MVFQKPRRVAVIGAGPAGAIATDALVKEQAFDTIHVFERQHAAGGTWCVYNFHDFNVGIASNQVFAQEFDAG